MSNINNNLGSFETLQLDNLNAWDNILSKAGAKNVKKIGITPKDIVFLTDKSLEEKIIEKVSLADQIQINKLKEFLKNQLVAEKIKNEIKIKEDVIEKKSFLTALPKLSSGKDTISFIMEFSNFILKENIKNHEWFNLLIKCLPNAKANLIIKEKEKYVGKDPSLDNLKNLLLPEKTQNEYLGDFLNLKIVKGDTIKMFLEKFEKMYILSGCNEQIACEQLKTVLPRWIKTKIKDKEVDNKGLPNKIIKMEILQKIITSLFDEETVILKEIKNKHLGKRKFDDKRYSTKFHGTCNNCHKYGHKAVDCYFKKKIKLENKQEKPVSYSNFVNKHKIKNNNSNQNPKHQKNNNNFKF
jgi:hypothetical protein